MFQKIGPLLENLESRLMFSHHSASVPAPLPTPPKTAAVSVKRHHRAAAAPAVFQVAGGLGGQWSGGQQAPGSSFLGTISLSIFQYGTADSYAILPFNRPNGEVVKVQSQF